MIRIRTLDSLALPARVFYRVDYNVPLDDDGRIGDATRIEETLPTLRRLLDAGCSVVIASHLGRPKGTPDPKYSLAPIREKLAELIGRDVQWSDDCVGAGAESKAQALQAGELLLLENLRFHAEEEKNGKGFAEQLRKLADVYLNDAFGACHRAHASIDALPRLFPRNAIAGGLLLAKEIEFLQKITNVSDRPFVALLGGAKIAGKIEALEALVKLADTVLIGGGMANTFLAAKGMSMGSSLVDEESIELAKKIVEGRGTMLMLPSDLVITDSIDAPTAVQIIGIANGVPRGKMAVDIGPRTASQYASQLGSARTVFWNGPMGVFEKEPFAKGTMAMAAAVASAHGVTVVGGGESVEAVKASGHADRISHISTGGGASLEFISGAKLPGVEVLKV
jgi:phosphoglycerate kinase